MSLPAAYLAGTDRQPEVWLYFDRAATHAANGLPMMEWVKKAPGRRWNPEAGCWVLTGFGRDKNPDAILARAGFTVNSTSGPPGVPLDPSLHDVLALADLVPPLVRASGVKPTTGLCRPRFTGWEGTRDLLGPGAIWDKTTGRFEVPLTDLLVHGEPRRGLLIEPDTLAAARALLRTRTSYGHADHSDERILSDAATAAASTGVDLSGDHAQAVARLVDVVGDLPDWFGMTPYPYQRVGALAIAAGRTFLADPMGLGKTLQIIGTFALRGVQRGVIVVPPVVVTNWANEIERCGLARRPEPVRKTAQKKKKRSGAGMEAGARTNKERASATLSDASALSSEALVESVDPLAPPSNTDSERASDTSVSGDAHTGEIHGGFVPGNLVVFRAGRKEPDLPERGVVIIPDSLLVSRPALAERIAQWNPDGLAYDEAHRARNWTSKRSEVVRGLAGRMAPGALRIAATGTPLFSSPADLAAILAISGHLDPVFGGYSAYMGRYCKRNHFNAWVPRLERLPELRAVLTDRVWVRRVKAEVLADLPKVSLHTQILDVDLAGFRAAHDEVIAKITDWIQDWVLDNEGEYPGDDEIDAYAGSQIGLVSPLRKAAGVAKVPATVDLVADWIADEVALNIDGSFTCERPLLLWAHHREVVEAIIDGVDARLKGDARQMVRVIDGSTSADRRGEIVAEFQAGRVPVLICSITAAGVGITLTRGSDQVFTEVDWDVPIVRQAIDRQNRIGQTNPVTVITLMAEGTLDAHIHKVLQKKARIIDEAIGDADAEVSGVDLAEIATGASPSAVLKTLIHEAIEKHQKTAKAARVRVAVG